jgi:hypothetical protein
MLKGLGLMVAMIQFLKFLQGGIFHLQKHNSEILKAS